MSPADNALFLLAQRYHTREQKKGTLKHWVITRKGPKNRKYICFICNKAICSDASKNPRTIDSEIEINNHGMKHLEERGLSDFLA